MELALLSNGFSPESVLNEPVTELSTELFRFWNSISSWGFRFEKMWCGFISLDQQDLDLVHAVKQQRPLSLRELS
ncbi:hypothetical protein KY285_033375 [Solanum tuberosum]|nr:hypothetical protein KY285_033375 [Solanum tuberosum]